MSVYKDKKATKPKIEDVIPECLDGDVQKTALDFVAYLRINKMSPIWATGNSWKSSNKGKGICYVKIDQNKLLIIPLLDHLNRYKELLINENLQSFIWNNIIYYPCKNCNPRCPTGRDRSATERDRTILGKKFNNFCTGRTPVYFYNPDEVTINFIKKLLVLESKERKKGHKAPYEHFRFYNDM